MKDAKKSSKLSKIKMPTDDAGSDLDIAMSEPSGGEMDKVAEDDEFMAPEGHVSGGDALTAASDEELLAEIKKRGIKPDALGEHADEMEDQSEEPV